LHEIDISFNQLTEFPIQLLKISALQRLYAFSCNMQKYQEAHDLSLSGLHLAELHMGNNPIRSVPDKFGFIGTLKIISAFSCGFTQIPSAVFIATGLVKV